MNMKQTYEWIPIKTIKGTWNKEHKFTLMDNGCAVLGAMLNPIEKGTQGRYASFSEWTLEQLEKEKKFYEENGCFIVEQNETI